ncbi:MAG TPA: class F sortase, partial [Anaerolineales bacterium]
PLTALTPVTVTGGGDYRSGNFATVTLGSYRWKAHYSGDPNNTNVNTACNDPNETSLVTAASTILPVTGFAPQHVTVLSAQPAEKANADLGDLWLEIPRLGVQMPIVGVPQSVDGTWDVSWLGNDAGWLQGSAFPTWTGNSVLTGHVYNPDGKPGPFVYLNQMWWDDKIIVHAGGAQYIYTVRTVTQVSPNDTAAMMKHQTIPWITLVTCRGYDQSSNSYKYRVLVRAVLVDVK